MLCSLKWMFYYADRLQFACETFFLSLYTPRLPKKTLDIQPEAWAVAKFFRLPSFSKRSLFRKVFDNKILGEDPGRGLQFMFWPTRPKNSMFRPSRPRLDMFRPTRPKLSKCRLCSTEEKHFDPVERGKRFRPSSIEEKVSTELDRRVFGSYALNGPKSLFPYLEMIFILLNMIN